VDRSFDEVSLGASGERYVWCGVQMSSSDPFVPLTFLFVFPRQVEINYFVPEAVAFGWLGSRVYRLGSTSRNHFYVPVHALAGCPRFLRISLFSVVREQKLTKSGARFIQSMSQDSTMFMMYSGGCLAYVIIRRGGGKVRCYKCPTIFCSRGISAINRCARLDVRTPSAGTQ